MDPDREEYLRRVKTRMDRIDAMPKDVREIVHEHGLTVVDALLAAGVTKGRVMRHLISVIRQGSSAWGNGTRGNDQFNELARGRNGTSR